MTSKTVNVEIGDRVHIPWDWDGSPCAEYVVYANGLVLIAGPHPGSEPVLDRKQMERYDWSALHHVTDCDGPYTDPLFDDDHSNMRLKWTD